MFAKRGEISVLNLSIFQVTEDRFNGKHSTAYETLLKLQSTIADHGWIQNEVHDLMLLPSVSHMICLVTPRSHFTQE